MEAEKGVVKIRILAEMDRIPCLRKLRVLFFIAYCLYFFAYVLLQPWVISFYLYITLDRSPFH